jgi:hypothetical protein
MLRLAGTILWPSFLVAIIAEGCFFSLFDPSELLAVGGHNPLPPIAGYTIGFFFLWIFCALASGVTYYLANVPPERGPST